MNSGFLNKCLCFFLFASLVSYDVNSMIAGRELCSYHSNNRDERLCTTGQDDIVERQLGFVIRVAQLAQNSTKACNIPCDVLYSALSNAASIIKYTASIRLYSELDNILNQYGSRIISACYGNGHSIQKKIGKTDAKYPTCSAGKAITLYLFNEILTHNGLKYEDIDGQTIDEFLQFWVDHSKNDELGGYDGVRGALMKHFQKYMFAESGKPSLCKYNHVDFTESDFDNFIKNVTIKQLVSHSSSLEDNEVTLRGIAGEHHNNTTLHTQKTLDCNNIKSNVQNKLTQPQELQSQKYANMNYCVICQIMKSITGIDEYDDICTKYGKDIIKGDKYNLDERISSCVDARPFRSIAKVMEGSNYTIDVGEIYNFAKTLMNSNYYSTQTYFLYRSIHYTKNHTLLAGNSCAAVAGTIQESFNNIRTYIVMNKEMDFILAYIAILERDVSLALDNALTAFLRLHH